MNRFPRKDGSELNIFLDMDGVISDFASAALRAHGSDLTIDQWPVGVWDIETVLGISSSQFWAKVNTYGFWRNIAPYPWLGELVELIETYDPNWRIATSPSACGQCLAGKYDWLREYIEPQFHRAFFVADDNKARYHSRPGKSQLAHPDTVLIDDKDSNVDQFVFAGGNAIRFPQPWNKNASELSGFGGGRFSYVKRQLQFIVER